jgi:hypothetical protein
MAANTPNDFVANNGDNALAAKATAVVRDVINMLLEDLEYASFRRCANDGYDEPPTRISVNTAMSLSEKLQNGSVLTNNNSLNNNEKIPDASKSKSINGKLTSPCVPQKKKEEKTLVVFFRDRYFRFITMKWTRIVLIPVFIAIVCAFSNQSILPYWYS